ncbi:hypothetical protein SRB5_05450 [Streptomyces sp. RB5]|uniref:Integral membrane protein n=1 Tax=Streptomyces smaragdinus TaxID=2585196 RepID=A0A7K0CAF6_9ACTN|nr:lysylphosphatidylglycerol synthase domain-containing protein [Streptomyces smaragdinus]MQY10437.1 hypothetical protein [Streptomyces smaragdinus]
MALATPSTEHRDEHPVTGQGSAKRPVLRRLIFLVPLLLIAGWAVANRSLLVDGCRELVAADRGWLAAAVVLMVGCWVPVCVARQGATLEPLPFGRLFATQVAAGTANHVLPAGLGAHAVTLRFLTRRGIPPARAAASLALYSLVEPAARVLLLLALIAVYPESLRPAGLLPDGGVLALTLGAVVVVAGLVAAVVFAVPAVRRGVGGFLRIALTDARAVHSRPPRLLALWGGAFAFPAAQATVLMAVATAMDVPVASMDVAIAYLAASVVAGGIPTPGGIGSVEAALTLALAAAGCPLALATGTVLGFRMITLWLPLIPGALLLGMLIRRKIL